MLAMSDVDIRIFIPIFAQTNIPVAFLVPTPTGYGKSIMDATIPIRELFVNENIHDYSTQGQGQENKKYVTSYFVTETGLYETSASLYRPNTKKGDPRIWFSRLTQYCNPCNLLAISVCNNCIYVFNLSNPQIANSLLQGGFAFDVLQQIKTAHESVSRELLYKIKAIHDRGFIPSITMGDPGVGDTLEHALGIERNNSRLPDYKGIELKASRTTRNGSSRSSTRTTMFTKTPDEGLTYRQILDFYGKIQIPRNSNVPRKQIIDTCKTSHPNAYGLQLSVDADNDILNLIHVDITSNRLQNVSLWYFNTLRKALLTKHHETFFVKAESIQQDGIEWFRYHKILHTKNPNASLIGPLIESDIITVDLAAHYNPDGSYKDHGVLFKMFPRDFPLLLSNPIEYDLDQM